MNRSEKKLKEYLKITPVNEEELESLKEWVAEGNRVHTNPSMATDEHGRQLTFDTALKPDEELPFQ